MYATPLDTWLPLCNSTLNGCACTGGRLLDSYQSVHQNDPTCLWRSQRRLTLSCIAADFWFVMRSLSRIAQENALDFVV